MTGLPMLSESSSANSSRLARSSSQSRIRIFLRSTGAIRAHGPSSNARRAERTARFTSSSPHAVTDASSWLVAGLITSKVAPEAHATCCPAIKAFEMNVCRAARCCQ
ncbi:hypothetical protein D3C84_730490 [compost metagenome]